MPLRKELKRGLVALVLLGCAGAATYAMVTSASASAASRAFRTSAKSAVATRLKHAP